MWGGYRTHLEVDHSVNNNAPVMVLDGSSVYHPYTK